MSTQAFPIHAITRRNEIPPRPISLNPSEPETPTAITRKADKTAMATRLNVAFLNRHLSDFSGWLTLPPLIEDVIYLAYTIEVKSTAPFRARDLAGYLTAHGIEIRDSHSFAGAEKTYIDEHSTSLCLGCHVTVSIADLQNIVNAVRSFLLPHLAAGRPCDCCG